MIYQPNGQTFSAAFYSNAGYLLCIIVCVYPWTLLNNLNWQKIWQWYLSCVWFSAPRFPYNPLKLLFRSFGVVHVRLNIIKLEKNGAANSRGRQAAGHLPSHNDTRNPPSQASPNFPPFSPKYADYAPHTVIGWLCHEEVSVATIKGRDFSRQVKN